MSSAKPTPRYVQRIPSPNIHLVGSATAEAQVIPIRRVTPAYVPVIEAPAAPAPRPRRATRFVPVERRPWLVMLVPPSWEVLHGRLFDRGTEDPAARECRLRVARAELDAVGEFDATVVNDDVRRAAQELINLMGGTGDRTPPARPL